MIQAFYNDFIPRGLFYDLTDNSSIIIEPNDRISGFNTNNIYQLLNPNLNSIQKFREKWEDEHASLENADLFNWYNVSLP